MMATARSPFFSRSSRMASIVTDAVTIAPPPMSSYAVDPSWRPEQTDHSPLEHVPAR